MIGQFTCTIEGKPVVCTLDDDGVWGSTVDEIERYLNLVHGKSTYQPSDGAFMRSAFLEALRVLRGKEVRLRTPAPLSKDGLP